MANKDAWLAFNVKTSELNRVAQIATKLHMKRVVVAVNLTAEEITKENLLFEDTQEIFKKGNVTFTIVKFGPTRVMDEAKHPYRVVRHGSLD